MSSSPSELITVLTTLGPVLTKTWRSDNTIGDYDDARNYTVEQRPVGGMADLYSLLSDLLHKPRSCVIRGKPRFPLAPAEAVERRLVNFADEPSHLLMLDIDGFVPALCSQPWADDQIDEALSDLISTLPPAFGACDAIWQASPSFGHPSKGSQLRGHLWFWLDKPLTCEDAELWVSTMLPKHCDCVVNRTVQVNYTSLPRLMPGVSYLVPTGSQLRVIPGWDRPTLTLPELDTAAVARMREARKGRKERTAMVDPRQKPNLVGAFCAVYAPEQIVDLAPDHFAIGGRGDPTRISWIDGPHAPEGIKVCDNGTHLVNTHNTSPFGNRAVNTFDFLRAHLFGDQDKEWHAERAKREDNKGDLTEDDFEFLETTNSQPPSYTAMCAWALEQPGVKDEWDARRPKGEEERAAAREKKGLADFEQWQADLAGVQSLADVRGRMVRELAKMHLSAWDLDRAKALLDQRMELLGGKANRRLLDLALKEAHRAQRDARTKDFVDLELAMATQVAVDHFGGASAPHLKRLGGGWWRYVNGLWRETDNDWVVSRVSQTVLRIKGRADNNMHELALTLLESGRSDHLSAFVTSVASTLRDKCVLDDTASDPLDLKGMESKSVINTTNCELWFDPRGEMEVRPHSPESNLTFQLACDFDPSAKAPLFTEMLKQIFSKHNEPEEVARHWLELAGMGMQQRRIGQNFVMMVGAGANGKSTLIRILEAVASPRTFYKGKLGNLINNDNHLTAAFVGKNFFVDDDLDRNGTLPDGALKSIAEEKLMTANPKGLKTFPFKARMIPFLLSNHWPRTTDISHGMLRRAQVFEMKRMFSETEQDHGLVDLICETELPGVLNLLIQAWQRVLRRGRFLTPKDCEATRAKWKAQANTTARFIASVLVRDEQAKQMDGQRVYAAYRNWMQANEGSQTKELGRNSFYEALRHAGVEVSTGHANVKMVKGWRLLDHPDVAGLGAEDDS